MVKSKFPGKPSRINQRNLVNAYNVSVPSFNSCSVSEDVWCGLTIFDRIFGCESEISNFNGFNFFEIEYSYQRKEQYNAEIQEKFAQCGITYSPFFIGDCPIINKSTEELLPSNYFSSAVEKFDTKLISVHSKKERRKHGKNWMLNKKIMNRYHSKIQMRHFKTLSKNSLIRFKHKTSSNYLSDKYCRKFILPSRSLHSSRVIKPNKRFLDIDKNFKSRIISKNFISNKCETDVKSNCEETNLINNYEKSCSVVVPPTKVIIREARLNITSEPVVAGPFSVKKNALFDKDKCRSGMITCDICGIVRCYKYILQTKKFGIHCCDPCRRFILKMIKQSKQPHYEIMKCKAENGMGRCLIPFVAMNKQKEHFEDSCSKNIHCSACWLVLCLQRCIIPNTIRKSLMRLIPEDLKVFSSNILSVDLKKALQCESENHLIKTDDINENLKKRSRMNYFLKSVHSNKRILEKSEINVSMKSKCFHFKRNVNNQRTNSKNKWIQESVVHEGNIEKDHRNSRGPRIKHVCRSASSVLKSSSIGSNDPDIEEIVCISQESDLDSQIQKDDIRIEKQTQLKKHRHYDDDSHISQTYEEYTPQQYGARSLQEFCKDTSYESDENEDKLISVDFWEAYDPDEIFKTGFPLITSDQINVRALCFLCGSTGLEKLLYCVSCCEPYHWFCAEGPSAFREESEAEKYRVNWVCRKCKVCSICGEGGSKLLMSCQRCRDSYHVQCLNNKALNKRLFKSDRPWVCLACLKCKSCNKNSVSTYVGNVPLCSHCFKLRQKGNYCPLCQGCYQDEDYNVQMMECSICKCWIHAKCEGISHEQYQILSFLPETVEFVCKLCCTTSPPRWWTAVEDKLKAGYFGILKYLCKSKQIAEFFKENSKKHCICTSLKRQSIGKTTNSVTLPSEAEFKNITSMLHVRRYFEMDNAFNESEENNAKLFHYDDEYSQDHNSEQLNDINTNQCSACCSSNNEIGTKIKHRLLMIKDNVHNNQYSSLLAFHQELENVISKIEVNLVCTYREVLKQFFPWFEPENIHCENMQEKILETLSNDSVSLTDSIESGPICEDDYTTLRKFVIQEEYKHDNYRMLDVRTCNLCKRIGEAIASEGGRLIYCGRNEWVHSNCALWSSEVFEEIDGSLQNVHSAISRGRQIRCFVCEKKGASVGCCFKNCGNTYHFFCAKKAHCKFFQSKTIYCSNHEVPEVMLPLLVNEKDFEILRPVYVETDKKKKKLECHANVKLRIGSLHIESLGKIDPHLSDDPKHIIPVYFRCTRLYWSTSKPWKIVQYRIQIKVSYSFQSRAIGETDINYTVDHTENKCDNVADNEIIHQVMNEVVNKVCCNIKNDRNSVYANWNSCYDSSDGNITNNVISNNSNNSDLLFPELQDTIYKDLPNDVLNDKTLHDIWNNYNGNNNDNDNEYTATIVEIQQLTTVTEKICKHEVNTKKFIDVETDDIDNCTQSNVKKQLQDAKKLNNGLDELKMNNKFVNEKFLRDKNDLKDNAFLKKKHRPVAVNIIDERFHDDLRTRISTKRKINIENSTVATKKRHYENDFAVSYIDSTRMKLGNTTVEYYEPYKNILQLDGMVDIYSDEEPVKCIQCHRTYRTTLSFERHLETCNSDFSDYTISSYESDSASGEEEKFTCATYETTIVTAPPSVKHSTSSDFAENTFYTKQTNTNVIVENSDKIVAVGMPLPQSTNTCSNIDLNSMYPYTATTYEDVGFIDNDGIIRNCDWQNARIQQSVLYNRKQETTPPIAITTETTDIEAPPVKLNFIGTKSESTAPLSSSCTDYAGAQFTVTNMSELQTFEYQNMITTPIPVSVQTTPTYILQPFPKAEIVPTYLAVNHANVNDSIRTLDSFVSQPLQLQQIANINQPTTSFNFQPSMPTILGTIVQPNIIETPTFIVNSAATTAPRTNLFNAQNNIVPPNQPLLAYGMETAVVSNTVMSSSQFMTQSQTGNVGGASAMYSTTTTQVFQAAKQLSQPDFSSNFIVLNSAAVSPQIALQPLQSVMAIPTAPAAEQDQLVPQMQRTHATITSTPNTAKYMCVQINELSKNVTSTEMKKPVVMKPANTKQNIPSKKTSSKMNNLRSSRPVNAQMKGDIVPTTNNSSTNCLIPSFYNVKNGSVNVKNVQVKTTEKCEDKNIQITCINSCKNASQTFGKSGAINNHYRINGLNKTTKNVIHSDKGNNKKGKHDEIYIDNNCKLVDSIEYSTKLSGRSMSQQHLNSQKQVELENMSEVESSSPHLRCSAKLLSGSLKNVINEIKSPPHPQQHNSKNIKLSSVTALTSQSDNCTVKTKINELSCGQKEDLKHHITDDRLIVSANYRKNAENINVVRCNENFENVLSADPLTLVESNKQANPLDVTVSQVPFENASNDSLLNDKCIRKNKSTISTFINETDRIFDELIRQQSEQSNSVITKNSQERAVCQTLPCPELRSTLHLTTVNDGGSSQIQNVKIQFGHEYVPNHSLSKSESINASNNIIHSSHSEVIDYNETNNKKSADTLVTSKTKHIPNVNQYRKCCLENENHSNTNYQNKKTENILTDEKKCNFIKMKKLLPQSSISSTTANVTVTATNTTNNISVITSDIISNNMPTSTITTTNNSKNWRTASISYEVNAEDGFSYKTNNLLDLWNKILESVQQSRVKYKLPLLPKNSQINSESVYSLLGFENNASKYLLEQLPDAWKCIFYKPVFHKSTLQGGKTTLIENVSGCARTEPFTSSHKYDMFGWLASRHRKPPKFMMISDSDIVNGNRRITSLNLPMAMRFRHLKETAKETVGVFRSDIHGRGLFCLRDIDAGEMVIEYAGEVIRSALTDKREKYYTSKGIGCYMFRIDDKYVVDATMCGNAARFINHSCEPNCYSRIVDILGKKHILIFALRRIPKGEELTYDYKFPLEDDKIFCHCLSRKCRKYLN